MLSAETIVAVRTAVDEARSRGARVAFVPTMGALHAGHLSLVDRARERADYVVASVFVNPLQFGPEEDFERYPRDLAGDAALLEGRGVDLLFVPTVEELYPAGVPTTRVVPGAAAESLCGRFRPGHFEGVLTVVAKLFNIVRPDVAVFGHKDFQQGVLIRTMVRDLNWPIEVELAPIVREPDGLALSSRNRYLAREERQRALALSRGLSRARDAFRAGERNADRLRGIVEAELASAGLAAQYAELVEPTGLQEVDVAAAGHVLAVAAFVGRTRLIDNVVLE